jgi:ketosteroid isomerase-like protein
MRHAVTIAALVLTVANAAELAAAFNAKEVEKVLGFYAENSVFMPPNAPLLRGRDPLKSFYTDMIAKGATDLRLEPDEVSGHGPIAYESGTYSVTYGDGSSRDRGKYLLVLRNMAGTWRTEKTIWSSDLPPSPAQAD